MEVICSLGLAFAKDQTFLINMGWKQEMVRQKMQQGPRMSDQWSPKREST